MALLLFCLTLLPLLVSPEILTVEPDSDQFFTFSAFSLKCEAQWTVKRRSESRVESCGFDKDFGNFDKITSTCVLNTPIPPDSGVYWCESADGTRSPERLLSVTDKNLILDLPGPPVEEGSNITLSCRTRPGTKSGSGLVLLKDGLIVQNSSEWTFTVEKKDEGEYSCRDGSEESETRRLQVTEIRTVEPDSDQFFTFSAFSLKCEAQWTVKRGSGSKVESCGFDKDFGNFDKITSTCLLNNPTPSDSGVYWCESADGTRSPERLLSVTDKNLILDLPGPSVEEGSNITLSCRTRPGTKSGSGLVLLKDGLVVQDSSEWTFTVEKKDEGEYSCRDGSEESETRRLQVTVRSSPEPSGASSGFTAFLLRHLVLLGLVFVGLVLVLVLVFHRRRTGAGQSSDPGVVYINMRRRARAET